MNNPTISFAKHILQKSKTQPFSPIEKSRNSKEIIRTPEERKSKEIQPAPVNHTFASGGQYVKSKIIVTSS
jgi:hypothetical protein